jgi:DNA-binding MarR family transcriptional regulator
MTKSTELLASSYNVAFDTRTGTFFVLTRRSHTILRYLANHPECLYEEICAGTMIPFASMMVYIGRMVNAGLVKKGKTTISGRHYTTLSLSGPTNLDLKIQRV